MKALSILFGICLVCCNARADESELRTVRARTLDLQIPKHWVSKAPTSEMRAAEFAIPGDPLDADLVVFYFGGPTGGIKANVERWIGQFGSAGRKLDMYQGKCKAGSYILVDTQGTWNKPDGPPFARKTISTPNSRVLNVIVIEEKDDAKDYYFLKLSGHQDVVGELTQPLRTAIGADPETEKAFTLKDAS